MAFETVQVVFKELTKLADCADEFSSLNRAAGVWLYFIGGYFPVLLHCPSVMANSVYDISEVGEDAMDFVASSFTEVQVCSSVHAGFFRRMRDVGMMVPLVEFTTKALALKPKELCCITRRS